MAAADPPLLGELTWATLAADHRPWRLKRGKHFEADLRELQRVAADQALEMGCAVRVVRDDLGRNQYAWLQFADHQIPLGAPCPNCASTELERTHEAFGRCPRCGARLIFAGTIDQDDAAPGAAPTKLDRKRARLRRWRLSAFSDVELTFDETASDDDQAVYYGRALDDSGRPVVVRVTYPLRDGERIPSQDEDDGDEHVVAYWHIGPYERARQLGLLDS